MDTLKILPMPSRPKPPAATCGSRDVPAIDPAKISAAPLVTIVKITERKDFWNQVSIYVHMYEYWDIHRFN